VCGRSIAYSHTHTHGVWGTEENTFSSDIPRLLVLVVGRTETSRECVLFMSEENTFSSDIPRLLVLVVGRTETSRECVLFMSEENTFSSDIPRLLVLVVGRTETLRSFDFRKRLPLLLCIRLLLLFLYPRHPVAIHGRRGANIGQKTSRGSLEELPESTYI